MPMTDAEHEENERKTLAIRARLLPHVAVIGYLTDRSLHGAGIVGNGTISLVDTGTRRILVTSRHVLEDFERLKASYPAAELVMSGTDTQVLSLTPVREIDRGGAGVDLATLELPSPQWLEEMGKQYASADHWPPAPVRVGNVLAFVGYPNVGLQAAGRDLIMHPLTFTDEVSEVTPQRIETRDPDRVRRFVAFSQDMSTLSAEAYLTGVSGSAAYVVSRGGAPQLAGFVFQGTGGLHAALSICPAKFLQQDGRVRV